MNPLTQLFTRRPMTTPTQRRAFTDELANPTTPNQRRFLSAVLARECTFAGHNIALEAPAQHDWRECDELLREMGQLPPLTPPEAPLEAATREATPFDCAPLVNRPRPAIEHGSLYDLLDGRSLELLSAATSDMLPDAQPVTRAGVGSVPGLFEAEEADELV